MFNKKLTNHFSQVVTALLSIIYLPVFASEKSSGNDTVLGFETAIHIAQQNDPWLTGNRFQQSAINYLSDAVNTFADPKISLGIANIATDSFDFNQEGMSQFKFGIAQVFPRGDTLSLKQQQLKLKSQQYPYQRQDRRAKVAVTVGTLWLNAYRAQHCIALIEENRGLFEQLSQVAQASYSSAVGKTRQQDVVRAQLELTRLDDRLAQLKLEKNHYQGQLSQWLLNEKSTQSQVMIKGYQLALSDFSASQKYGNSLPNIQPSTFIAAILNTDNQLGALLEQFQHHPVVKAIEKKINSTATGIEIAQQKYSPQWAVSASYGYRGNDMTNNNRADLLSVGVTFDLPLFTENKQDKEVSAAIAQSESVKTEKYLQLRELLASYASVQGRLAQLAQRKQLFNSRLLPQMHDQAEASLTAYTNDDGSFSEVVRARIAELNAVIDDFTLDVEQQKLHLALNYLFVTSK